MKKRISLLAVCVVFTMVALMACGEKEPIPTGNSTGVEEFVTGLSLASNQSATVAGNEQVVEECQSWIGLLRKWIENF